MKAILVVIVVAIVAALVIPFLRFTPLEPEVAPSPTPQPTITKAAPCKAIDVKSPFPNQKITPPKLTVTVVINNSNPACRWTVFEAQAGTLELQDENQNTIATGTLSTTQDWMTVKPVTYQGTISFDAINTQRADLIITEENPSGGDNPQTISIPLLAQ